MIRLISVALISSCLAVGAVSAALADASCKVQATDKKLAGAALTSFSKKCAKDAASACEAQAAGKKLAGAAKTSFVKKCTSDAVGG
ncbi:hypothetical protein LMIY3S_03206 [Labrys miyagiensis]